MNNSNTVVPGVFSSEVGRKVMGNTGRYYRLSDRYIMSATVVFTVLFNGNRWLEYYSFWSTEVVALPSLFMIVFTKNTGAVRAQKTLANQLLKPFTACYFSRIIFVMVAFNVVLVKRAEIRGFPKMNNESLVIFSSSGHY